MFLSNLSGSFFGNLVLFCFICWYCITKCKWYHCFFLVHVRIKIKSINLIEINNNPDYIGKRWQTLLPICWWLALDSQDRANVRSQSTYMNYEKRYILFCWRWVNNSKTIELHWTNAFISLVGWTISSQSYRGGGAVS